MGKGKDVSDTCVKMQLKDCFKLPPGLNLSQNNFSVFFGEDMRNESHHSQKNQCGGA